MRDFLFVILSLALAYPSVVAAVGVGVEPTSLNLTVGRSGYARAELEVGNPSGEAGLYVVSADDFSSWFSFSPAQLRLEAGERQRVKVTAQPQRTGRFATTLSVVGYPLDTRSFNAGSGLKVPVRLDVDQLPLSNTWRYYLLVGGLALLTLASGLLLWHRRRRSVLLALVSSVGGWHLKRHGPWQRLRRFLMR